FGNFTEIADAAGLLDPMQTWSSAWGDYDNDGDMDVFVGNSTDPFAHKLMTNNGDGTFTNISASSGVQNLEATGIENCTYDFNNDGFIDIASNGNIFLNNGDLTFSLYNNVLPSNNGCFGDLNNDGFVDSFTGSTLFINDANDNNYLTINTVGVESNRNGIGARITVTSDLGSQIREVRSGEGFRLMSTLNTHFGLGQDDEITSITVQWPSGIIDTLDNVSVNQTIVIVEGSTILNVNDQDPLSIVLSPNPVRDVLTVSGTQVVAGAQYEIFDLQGKIVAQGMLQNGSVNVGQLAQGAYVLRLAQNGGARSQRFIKK
ncbi:MAG: T9SS C-terminal target domain-containing protein, partial [Flavobacteriaceae bacterium]|nr:T9SS C-terminal target domain-containing protein [Flavobacteriaceae bacterium]